MYNIHIDCVTFLCSQVQAINWDNKPEVKQEVKAVKLEVRLAVKEARLEVVPVEDKREVALAEVKMEVARLVVKMAEI